MRKPLKLPSGVKNLFASTDSVKLVYLFGSRATGKIGPLSDYDFGIFLSEKKSVKRTGIKIGLITQLNKLLKTDAIDVVILNDAESPELKYHIIKDGILIYQVEPYKVMVEPRILIEYFDFVSLLQRYGLTKV